MSESGEATQATETPAATEANGKGHRNGHGVAPIDFPPPVQAAEEFVGPPTDPEDERIDVGVAIVVAGKEYPFGFFSE